MSYKAIAMARGLADSLRKRLTLTVTESFDTDGAPLLSINDGTPAAGEQNALIKIRQIDWPLVKDVLGLAQTVFTPHVAQLVTEARTGEDYLVKSNLMAILGDVMAMGCKVEWYESTNGSAPAATDIDPTKLVASYESLYYPMISGQ